MSRIQNAVKEIFPVLHALTFSLDASLKENDWFYVPAMKELRKKVAPYISGARRNFLGSFVTTHVFPLVCSHSVSHLPEQLPLNGYSVESF